MGNSTLLVSGLTVAAYVYFCLLEWKSKLKMQEAQLAK